MNSNTTWSDVLGNNATATQAYRQYVAERSEEETLASWMARKATELWPDESDPAIDYETLAAALERQAREETTESIVQRVELVSAGQGEVNEARETAALREWLGDYSGDYTPELQAEWEEWVEENEPQYDEAYD